jgi:hypothetical protein
MGFEWDEAKAARNAIERGLPFELAARLFDGPVVEADDPRPWPERRVKAIGPIDGRLCVVACTDRGEARRITLLRGAHRDERALYWRILRERLEHG